MTWVTITNTLIFVLGIFFAVLEAIWLSHIWAEKLPGHLRLALVQFAEIAVRQVEQQNKALSGSAKKELAIAIVTRLFHAFALPLPNISAVETAIESAVFLLPKGGV